MKTPDLSHKFDCIPVVTASITWHTDACSMDPLYIWHIWHRCLCV